MTEKQYQANLKMRRNMDKTIITYECPCNNDKKHLHHPDYDRPLLVVKLCPSCHAQETSRLSKKRILCEGCGINYRHESEKICWNCELLLKKGFKPRYPKTDFRGRPLKANLQSAVTGHK